jgi:hypothetical protein
MLGRLLGGGEPFRLGPGGHWRLSLQSMGVVWKVRPRGRGRPRQSVINPAGVDLFCLPKEPLGGRFRLWLRQSFLSPTQRGTAGVRSGRKYHLCVGCHLIFPIKISGRSGVLAAVTAWLPTQEHHKTFTEPIHPIFENGKWALNPCFGRKYHFWPRTPVIESIKTMAVR